MQRLEVEREWLEHQGLSASQIQATLRGQTRRSTNYCFSATQIQAALRGEAARRTTDRQFREYQSAQVLQGGLQGRATRKLVREWRHDDGQMMRREEATDYGEFVREKYTNYYHTLSNEALEGNLADSLADMSEAAEILDVGSQDAWQHAQQLGHSRASEMRMAELDDLLDTMSKQPSPTDISDDVWLAMEEQLDSTRVRAWASSTGPELEMICKELETDRTNLRRAADSLSPTISESPEAAVEREQDELRRSFIADVDHLASLYQLARKNAAIEARGDLGVPLVALHP